MALRKDSVLVGVISLANSLGFPHGGLGHAIQDADDAANFFTSDKPSRCAPVFRSDPLRQAASADGDGELRGINLYLKSRKRVAYADPRCHSGKKGRPHRTEYSATFLSKVVALTCCLGTEFGDRVVMVSTGDGLRAPSQNLTARLRSLGIPVLVFSALVSRNDLMQFPDPYFTGSKGHVFLTRQSMGWSDEIPWDSKHFEVRFRGHATGQVDEGESLRLKVALLSKSDNFKRLNAAIVGSDIGRSQASQSLQELGVMRNRRDPKWMIAARGVLDIDGNTNSWGGLWWKLASNSVVIKVESHWSQWYYGLLHPWEHYIPVRADLQDLWDRVDYVLNRSNDEALRRIATASTDLIQSITTKSASRQINHQLVEFFRSYTSS